MNRSSLGRPWTLPMESLRPKRTAAAKEEKSSSNPGSLPFCSNSGSRYHLSHSRRGDPEANVDKQNTPKCTGWTKPASIPLIPVSSNKGLSVQPLSFLNDTERRLHQISHQCRQQKRQVPGFFIPSVFH